MERGERGGREGGEGVARSGPAAASPSPCPQLATSTEGAAANLGKGFGHKGGGYLCVSTGGQVRGAGGVRRGMKAPGAGAETLRVLVLSWSRSQALDPSPGPNPEPPGPILILVPWPSNLLVQVPVLSLPWSQC